MNKTTNTFSGTACVDCVMIIANDDDSGMDSDTAVKIRAALAAYNSDGMSVNVDTIDSEPRFSDSQCDVCETRLAGDRLPVTFIW